MSQDRIKSYLDRHQRQMVETLSRLVAIPTVNPPGQSYKPCVKSVFLTTRGFLPWPMDPVSSKFHTDRKNT